MSSSASKRRNLALALAAAGAIAPCTHVFGQALFTTQDDFNTNWSFIAGQTTYSTAATGVPAATYDFDGATTNGLGNTTNAGITGTAGALQVTLPATLPVNGFGQLVAGPQGGVEFANSGFMNAWDPGSVANGADTTVAFSGTMYMVYSTPTWSTAPSYYDLGLEFQYAGDGYYNQFFPTTTTSAGLIDGQLTTIATIPYTVSAGGTVGSNSGFGMDVLINVQSNAVASSPIYIDDISMTLPTVPVIPPNSATWQPGGTGIWSNAAADKNNWVGSAPPATSTSDATFDNGGAASGPVGVNVAITEEVNNLTFDNSHGYSLNGSQVIVAGTLTSTAGPNTINSLDMINSTTDSFNISPGSSVTATTFVRSNFTPLALSGGGTLNVNTINNGNVELSGGSTLAVTGSGTVASGSAFLFDIGVSTAADTVNLGTNNQYDSNSLSGSGTIIIGAGTTLTTDEFNGFTGFAAFNGSLSGSGAVILGSIAGANANVTSLGYTGTFNGTSPSFTGPITVAYDNVLQVGPGATLGNASPTNTLTLDSGMLQAGGNATLAQNITMEDTQTFSVIPNTTTIDTQTNTLSLTGHISGGNSLLKIGTGTLILGASNSYSGGTNVTGGTLLVAAPGALPLNNALSITNSSTVKLADNVTAGGLISSSNVFISSLSIDSTSVLDIGNNRLIIDYGAGADPIASIAQWIKNGFYSLSGPQIMSSDTAADDTATGFSYGIGYADGADHLVAGLPSGEIEIMFTLLGDANLDGTVNTEDFTPLSTNQAHNGGWDQGDFNYDGTINTEDFTPFSHDLSQTASLAAAAGVLESADGLANVPEPASMGLVLLAGMGALSRRSRRRKQQPR